MVLEILEDGQSAHRHHHLQHNQEESSWLKVSWIGWILGIASVAFVVGAVIKIRRAVIDFSNTSVITVPSFSISDRDTAKETKEWVTKTMRHTYSTPLKSCANFWKFIPRRFWNFYIEACLIPHYRKEWGHYKEWNFRAPPRPEKSPLLRAELRRRKLEKKSEIHNKHDPGPPNPPPHNHSECQRVRINVSGSRYETQERTLRRYPETLLGDPSKRIKYYNPGFQEYFFDRNQTTFEIILYFYQSGGKLIRTDNVQADILLDDLRFYEIPEGVIYQYLVEEGLTSSESYEDIFPQNLFMRKIWLLFDYPESSIQARFIAILSIFSIALSITTFCAETLSSLMGRARRNINLATGVATQRPFNSMDIRDPFFFGETICSIWFSIEFIARLCSSPRKLVFIKSFLNIIDFIAIIPYFFTLFAQTSSTKTSATASFSVVRVVRLVRVFRIFKLTRHSRGLKILGKTLRASMNELMLLIFFVLIGVILFSSTIYFAELGTQDTHFASIPDGFWWALITITTVGYGDAVPVTSWGKVVGALCALAGVLTIALPVPVIVSNFNFFYNQSLGEQDLSWMKINHVPNCPFRPTDNTKPTAASGHAHSKSRSRVTVIDTCGESDSTDNEFVELTYNYKMNPKPKRKQSAHHHHHHKRGKRKTGEHPHEQKEGEAEAEDSNKDKPN